MNAVTGTKAAQGQDAPAHKSLYAALAAAQAEMGKALKDTNNPHFKSKYADLASVADACMPALSRHGIAVLQPPFDDESGRYVKTILVHGESGESTECRVPLIVDKNNMQGYGSAVTYARRYGLMGMAGIAPEDDDGNAAAAAPPRQQERQTRQEQPATITPDQFRELRAKADQAGVPEGRLCEAYQAPSLQEFTADAFERAMKKLQATIDAKPPQSQPDNAELDDEIPY